MSVSIIEINGKQMKNDFILYILFTWEYIAVGYTKSHLSDIQESVIVKRVLLLVGILPLYIKRNSSQALFFMLIFKN